MLLRILSTVFMLFFIAACGSTPKDTASSSDAGTITETSSVSGGVAGGTQDDLVINVGDRVFFGYDSHDLSSDAQEQLQVQASWMKQYSEVSLTVEGHCDERGTREYNIALGERRAQAMKNYLIGLGVEAGRLSTISYGKERPAVLGSNDAAYAQNRRAVAVVN
ncbi:MAG: Outer membrane lipoprotein Omp16 [Alphaproteobacteria bacterium MarineAlpha5_Bin11]|nr:peptidoglycan-associated lipoprotein [Pelagibacteraceae bacterium]PPR42980.1 MAG: Outer membrane lipoprotein Omp16 [Alphaproteobacteria bacterium MarineAlpha5_Bin11]|tara:strand:+ start:197 stop:688 length:492 start_codon:yes stop_codon:yes gene_type:complete